MSDRKREVNGALSLQVIYIHLSTTTSPTETDK